MGGSPGEVTTVETVIWPDVVVVVVVVVVSEKDGTRTGASAGAADVARGGQCGGCADESDQEQGGGRDHNGQTRSCRSHD